MNTDISLQKLKEKMAFELKKCSEVGILRGTKYFHRATDKIVSDRLESEPELYFDCQAGCSDCCDVRVEVITPEAILIAGYLNDTLDNDSLDELKARITEHIATTKGKTLEEHVSRCPFLSQKCECSIYEVRPHKCRKMYSMSVDHCRVMRTGAEEVVLLNHQNGLGNHYLQMLIDARVSPMPAELCEAVLRLMSSPSIVSHWLKGVQIFDTLPEYEQRN